MLGTDYHLENATWSSLKRAVAWSSWGLNDDIDRYPGVPPPRPMSCNPVPSWSDYSQGLQIQHCKIDAHISGLTTDAGSQAFPSRRPHRIRAEYLIVCARKTTTLASRLLKEFLPAPSSDTTLSSPASRPAIYHIRCHAPPGSLFIVLARITRSSGPST